MTEQARSILERFAAAFPKSSHFQGGRKLRLGKWEEHYPGLETDLDLKEEFLAAVEELVQSGIVSAKWRRFREGTHLEALYLEDAEGMYAALGRPSPNFIRRRMIEVLGSPAWSARDSHGLREAIREHLLKVLDSAHPVSIGSPETLEDLGTLLTCNPEDTATTPIRALSVRLFNDSKRLEGLLPQADADAQRAAGVTVSEAYGLSRSYPEVTIAMRGSLLLGDGGPSALCEVREWQCRGEPVILSRELANRLEAIHFANPGSGVLSVENKETFYALAHRLMNGGSRQFAGLVYAAGHPHPGVIRVLDRCAEAGAELYHFGDLDPDGLFILSELAEGTDRPVRPFSMDARVYEEYKQFGYRLHAPAVARLRSAMSRLPESLRAVAELIVENGIGVEQEVIGVD